eukprot:TRINITY_DN3529_c0_g2_i11.p1 TRINITY_DN3529_c0_g2~~TRINITY_DN3529_c0_g2_i11.p1  ORF type:complete len:343 (-),score=94.75 TRINITY_DN3529_c0_g2_i11:797-1825(-)
MEGDDAWEVVNEHGESGQGAGGGESTAVAVAVAGRRRQHVPEIQPSLEVLEAEQEMRELEAMMERWRVPNTHKPFAKNVVCMLGTTSSGKSSFVNHFFGVGVKKTAMCQLDTHFTLVEVIPEEDFAKLVGATYKRKDISAAELKDSSLEQVADRRRNCVYMVLNSNATLVRHEQFESFAEVFRKHELVTSILINEFYLPNDVDEETQRRRKHTILIDSPGFTANTDFMRLRDNLKVLQYLYSLSDLTLFFIPSDSINLVASQVAMLELSVLYALYGEGRFTEVLELACHSPNASKSFSIVDMFSKLSSSSHLFLGGAKHHKYASSLSSFLFLVYHWLIIQCC